MALRLAHQAEQIHGIDFSEAMLAVFRHKIEQAGHRNIDLHCGDAQTLPYADATFDAAFSLFGLMFFPDRKQGFAEIYRTLKPGGSIALTSWAPVDQSPAMQAMFGALRAIKPDLPQPQRSIATLENPERFKQEMQEAGFHNIEIRSVTKIAFDEWQFVRQKLSQPRHLRILIWRNISARAHLALVKVLMFQFEHPSNPQRICELITRPGEWLGDRSLTSHPQAADTA